MPLTFVTFYSNSMAKKILTLQQKIAILEKGIGISVLLLKQCILRTDDKIYHFNFLSASNFFQFKSFQFCLIVNFLAHFSQHTFCTCFCVKCINFPLKHTFLVHTFSIHRGVTTPRQVHMSTYNSQFAYLHLGRINEVSTH